MKLRRLLLPVLRTPGARLAGLGVLVLLGLVLAWQGRRLRDWWSGGRAPQAVTASPSSGGTSPPRLTSPYRNVAPEVHYVGDAVCSTCHAGIARSYHSHPMARSFSPAAAARPVERYEAAAHNPFVVGRLLYAIEHRGEHVSHTESVRNAAGQSILAQEAEIHFVLGSGRRGRSYVINQGDGYLFASPISWYPQKERWDLAPGYAQHNVHFSRPIGPDCLFCHANPVEHVASTANRYRLPPAWGTAIGCERCHGPGALHVQRQQNPADAAGGEDTIVNPRNLEHDLREAVCQQCHLQGEQRVLRRGRRDFDYRPGLPLQAFFIDFVQRRPAETTRFVGTVEQMYASRCFQASHGPDRLGCTSCHDPHQLPAAASRAAYYRERCLRCHADSGCRLPEPVRLQQTNNDCLPCHMPRTGSEVNHTSITDHRILRRPDQVAPPTAPLRAEPGQYPLLPFPRGTSEPEDLDLARDLGVALIDFTEKQPDATARQLSALALPLLQRAVAATAEDPVAWEALGSALWLQGQLPDALAAFETGLKQTPGRESSLFLAASVALRLDRRAAARSFAEQARQANPWRWQYPEILANVHARDADWPRAVQACQATLQLQPTQRASRALLVTAYLRTGDRAAAQAELERLRALTPPEQHEALGRWFERQERERGER